MAKKSRRRISKRRKPSQRKTKVNKNTFYLGLFALIVIVVVLIYYFSPKDGQPFFYNGQGEETRTTTTTPTIGRTETSTGGHCKSNYECFVTSCKGQSEDCINATQMSTYANENCRTYSDWNNVKQDSSRCACMQNACTMVR